METLIATIFGCLGRKISAGVISGFLPITKRPTARTPRTRKESFASIEKEYTPAFSTKGYVSHLVIISLIVERCFDPTKYKN